MMIGALGRVDFFRHFAPIQKHIKTKCTKYITIVIITSKQSLIRALDFLQHIPSEKDQKNDNTSKEATSFTSYVFFECLATGDGRARHGRGGGSAWDVRSPQSTAHTLAIRE